VVVADVVHAALPALAVARDEYAPLDEGADALLGEEGIPGQEEVDEIDPGR
jgi:hypothetical protein